MASGLYPWYDVITKLSLHTDSNQYLVTTTIRNVESTLRGWSIQTALESQQDNIIEPNKTIEEAIEKIKEKI